MIKASYHYGKIRGCFFFFKYVDYSSVCTAYEKCNSRIFSKINTYLLLVLVYQILKIKGEKAVIVFPKKKKSYHKAADTALSQCQKREIMHLLHFQLTSHVPFSFRHQTDTQCCTVFLRSWFPPQSRLPSNTCINIWFLKTSVQDVEKCRSIYWSKR